MRAISLWQPWASLIATGKKHFETRSWPTTYRGPLAIHAAKRKMDAYAIDVCRAFGLHTDVPFGAVLCIVNVTDCVPTQDLNASVKNSIERYCCDFGPGRFAWELEWVRRLPSPVPFKGSQGFFVVPDELVGADPQPVGMFP